MRPVGIGQKCIYYLDSLITTLLAYCLGGIKELVIKDTLSVLRHAEPLVHVSVDISLITKHILDHDISLKS